MPVLHTIVHTPVVPRGTEMTPIQIEKPKKLCGAIPRGGDGTLLCDKPAFHPGLHKGNGVLFRMVEPKTTARSKRWAQRKRRDRNI